MAEQNPIRYQDLISPDDSIEKLIGQLEALQQSYTNMANSVKSQAQQVADSLTKVSGATEQGRKKIKESNDEAARLEKAYKQLDAALASNAKEIAKLNIVRREANNYNKQMVLRGQEEIKTRQQIKEASYQQLSAQYSLNKAYLNTLSATDRNIKANRELIKTTKEIYEQMKKLQADTGKMQLNVGNYPMLGGLLNGVGGKALGIGGAAAAGMALAGVIKNNVSLATEYEKSLSVLAAILGTTKEGVQQLSEQAQHLGATTVYTAKEVAELQTELAKLGYTTDQIMNMAPSVLNFAQATGSSLADAASLAGAALRMFEKDTTHTTEFVDKMSAATTKSALNFSYLQNAMSTVAPVANAFGFKLEDVLSLLGQLANAGFDASSAATATRNIILNLADANGKLAQSLGAPVNDLDGLINGLQSLNDRGIDLGESLELTDKRSVAAFNTFLKGTKNVLDLRDALADCDGYAQQMADTMADNMEGSLKGLDSAWQGLNLTLNQSNGLFRDMVDWLTSVVRWLDKAAQKIDRWWKKYKFMFTGDKEDWITSHLDEVTEEVGGGKVTPSPITFYGEEKHGAGTASGVTGGKSSTKANKAAQAAQKAAIKEQERQQKEILSLRRKFEDASLELIEDANSREYAKVSLQYNRQIEDAKAQLEKLAATETEGRKYLTDTIVALEKTKAVKLADLVEKQGQKQQEDAERKLRREEQTAQQSLREQEKAIELEYDLQMEGIEQLETSEKKKTRMRLEAERDRLQKLLKLYEQDGKKLSEKEVALIKKQIETINNELDKNEKSNKDIYDVLGFDLSDEKKEAINTSLDYAMDALNQWMDAISEAADRKRELADAEVERTHNVLMAELEARNNGYANSVEMARKEYEQSKQMQQKAIQEQKRAQHAKLAMDTISQASNLVTATSLIMANLPFPWFIPAIAVMWGTFAAAKIKAMQMTSSGNEEYGDGTVQLLDGGSHQSGNDIDLGRKKDGTRRRAEGGEYLAIINKRSSRKYRSVIPDVVNSLNQGTFADKYLNAYDGGAINIQPMAERQDLTQLSDDVRTIREQGESRTYVDGHGRTVVKYKNVKRTVLN